MIELITGTPGAGKSLYAISTLKARAEKENRPVYYSGIADLKLPWIEIEGDKWYEAPANSIVIIDECQRIFRPRGNGSQVPQYVSELETHRHKGLDLVLITQHPMLIDSNVRRLIGRHQHVSRRFGLKRASIFEYESCKDQPLAKIDSATSRHEWSYPKDAFSYYKSAEVHTHKARIPAKMYIIVAALVLAIGSAWYMTNRWAKKMSGSVPGSGNISPGQVEAAKAANPYQYFEDRNPRLVGLPASAPIYDKVTAPVRAPMPVACVRSSLRCQCYSQQGTRIDTGHSLCEAIVKNGYFVDWQEKTIAENRPVKPAPVGGAQATLSGVGDPVVIMPITYEPAPKQQDLKPIPSITLVR
jgi:zona occludens toxin